MASRWSIRGAVEGKGGIVVPENARMTLILGYAPPTIAQDRMDVPITPGKSGPGIGRGKYMRTETK
jgi:hypothetical protein